VEDEVKEQDREDEGEVEWVAAGWVQVENADAHNAAIPCHIKLECHATNKPARNVGLK
jgi:hypothetical protein